MKLSEKVQIPTAIILSVGMAATMVLVILGKVEAAVFTGMVSAIVNAFTKALVKPESERTTDPEGPNP